MSQVLQKLQPYLPQGALPLLRELMGTTFCQIKISKPRQTKVGDYRRPQKPHQPHRISVNANLNPYAFLITLLHEWAHLEVYQEHQGKVAPHGPEWQAKFREVAQPFLEKELFPSSVAVPFLASLQRGDASTATNLPLHRALKEQDPEPELDLAKVEELREGAHFLLGKFIYIRGPKSRKRYQCRRLHTHRIYMVHPQAEVRQLSPPEGFSEKISS